MITIKKNLKKILLIIVLFIGMFSFSCVKKNATPNTDTKEKTETKIQDTYYSIKYIIDGKEKKASTIKSNSDIELYEAPVKDGFLFHGWYIDIECTTLFTDKKITSDTILYGYYEDLTPIFTVTFVTNCDMELDNQTVRLGGLITNLPELSRDGYYFSGWYTDERLHNQFDIDNDTINSDLVLYAKWKLVEAEYINLKFISVSDNLFTNKDDLYIKFYTYFYMFIVEHTEFDLEETTLDDFLLQGKTWEIDGKSDMYHFGNRYCNLYLKNQEGGKLEEQDPDHFLGYCYKNGMFIDLIHHLEVFFAYWRTDEGYTGSSDDPNNTGNDFYIDCWSAMVDTAKFFFFTGDTLQDKYDWFTSRRVKEALDHIPSVLEINNTTIIKDEEYIFNYDFEDYSVKYYLDSDLLEEIEYLPLEYIENYDNEELVIYVKIGNID